MSARKVRVRLVLSPRDRDEPAELVDTTAHVLLPVRSALADSLAEGSPNDRVADEQLETEIRSDVGKHLDCKAATLAGVEPSNDIRWWPRQRAILIAASRRKATQFREALAANSWRLYEVTAKAAFSAAFEFLDKKSKGQ
jgi:hypothetical protein